MQSPFTSLTWCGVSTRASYRHKAPIRASHRYYFFGFFPVHLHYRHPQFYSLKYRNIPGTDAPEALPHPSFLLRLLASSSRHIANAGHPAKYRHGGRKDKTDSGCGCASRELHRLQMLRSFCRQILHSYAQIIFPFPLTLFLKAN